MKAVGKAISQISISAKTPSIIWTAVFLLTYSAMFFLSGTSRANYWSLEHAWNAVLEYATRHELQFGRDVVFTYGPLGFLNGSIGQGLLVPQRILFAFAWCGVISWSVICVARKLPNPARYVFLAWVLLFSYVMPLEQHAYLVMAYGCMVLMGDVLQYKTEAVVYLITFVALSLIKFTFFLAAVVSLAICCVVQAGKGNVKLAAGMAACFAGVFLVFWRVSGQQVIHVLPWLRGSLEVTAGYTEAMHLVPKQNVLWVCAIAGIAFLAGAVIRTISVQLTFRNTGILLVTVLYVFLSWKQGLVRADGHVMYFIVYLPIAFALLLTEPFKDPLSSSTKWTLDLLFLGVICLCALAATYQNSRLIRDQITAFPKRIVHNASLILKSPLGECSRKYAATRAPSQEERDIVASMSVPRAMIGNATVDVISFHQMAALSNELNYHPRPVIQSYSAYTPYLQELNREFFQSERRPEYILLRMETIDNRFPTLDEATTLPYILQNYNLVWHDDFMLLLKLRGQEPLDVHLKKIGERKIAFGERLDLSAWRNTALFMRVDIKPTVMGRLIKFVYQPAAITLYARTGGESTDNRFIPAMAKHGFIISPFLETNADMVRFFQRNARQVESIVFAKPESACGQYADSITVQLFTFE